VAGSGDVTEVLLRVAQGAQGASEELYTMLYDELRRMAQRQLRRERPNHTLQPTELVHEAYVRLIDMTRSPWKNRAHFFAIASRVMRRILVDHARSRGRQKRGGGWQRVPFEAALEVGTGDDPMPVLALDAALGRLAEKQPDKARVVEMHFFGGLTHEECAEVLGVSSRTVLRYWEYSKAWLYREMSA
jgi:RNA polymerase sigma factor (TIGR02999 family)